MKIETSNTGIRGSIKYTKGTHNGISKLSIALLFLGGQNKGDTYQIYVHYWS